MTASNAIADPMTDDARSIVQSRLFDAPRELVFAAFTNPEHISNWWGPRGFTTTTHEIDFRPGGTWRFVMHGPDGTDYLNKIVYREIVKPERLVYAHAGEGDTADIHFSVTVTFEEQGDKTLLTMRSLFDTAAARNRVVEEFGAIEGGKQTLERLGEQIARMVDEPFRISRTFDAPRELVWRAWTDAEHLVHWFGPKGFPMFHAKNDPREGGTFHYGLRMPNGGDMWGRWTYREIVPPRRLVFISSFSNEAGELAHAPFADDWPLEMLTTITLVEEGGKTTVTVESAAFNATEAQRKVFTDNHRSMQGGWSGTFEQLGAYLDEVRS